MPNLAGQTYAFLMTIFAGGIVGLLFDVYRVFRSIFRPRQIATAITDLLYWIAVTPVSLRCFWPAIGESSAFMC